MNAMNARVLESRDDPAGRCFLCSISLEDYVAALPSTYQEYDIQRGIVSNVYLDRLVETVVARRHIPPIVLVVTNGDYKDNARDLLITRFKILDGLQRTVRLKAIRDTVEFCLPLDDTANLLAKNKFVLSRQFAEPLRAINSNVDVLIALLKLKLTEGPGGLRDCFRGNFQWFEIWTGLQEADEIRLMLTLNAGHKPVTTRHQLELLFLNLLAVLQTGEGNAFQLVREKDVSSTRFSKSREIGQFHFASVITSLLSLYEGRPVVPTTGLIQQLQDDQAGLLEFDELADPTFLRAFVAFLVRVDRVVVHSYESIGLLWMGREVSLAGMCGAIGAFAKESGTSRRAAMDQFCDTITARPSLLNLQQFEDQRNALDLSKVNIGAINRSATCAAVKDLLEKPLARAIDWRKYFAGGAR